MGTLRKHVREGSNTDYTIAHPVTASYGKQIDSSDRSGGPPNLIHGVRRLTPLECERLQGFPDNWTVGHADSNRYKMLGNAVAVPVIEWIGRRLHQCFDL